MPAILDCGNKAKSKSKRAFSAQCSLEPEGGTPRRAEVSAPRNHTSPAKKQQRFSSGGLKFGCLLTAGSFSLRSLLFSSERNSVCAAPRSWRFMGLFPRVSVLSADLLSAPVHRTLYLQPRCNYGIFFIRAVTVTGLKRN